MVLESLTVGRAYALEPLAVGKVLIIEGSSLLRNKLFLLQYTNWENLYDGYIYQQMVADVVGDYFFICPSIHFAQLFAERGMKVYYYFFTQVGSAFYRHVRLDCGNVSRETRPIDRGLLCYSLTFPRDDSHVATDDNAARDSSLFWSFVATIRVTSIVLSKMNRWLLSVFRACQAFFIVEPLYDILNV